MASRGLKKCKYQRLKIKIAQLQHCGNDFFDFALCILIF